MSDHPTEQPEPIGGQQAEFDVAAVAAASREVIEAATMTVAFLQMMLKDWIRLAGAGAYSESYRTLAEIEVQRLTKTLELLERLQYPSHFKTKGV